MKNRKPQGIMHPEGVCVMLWWFSLLWWN